MNWELGNRESLAIALIAASAAIGIAFLFYGHLSQDGKITLLAQTPEGFKKEYYCIQWVNEQGRELLFIDINYDSNFIQNSQAICQKTQYQYDNGIYTPELLECHNIPGGIYSDENHERAIEKATEYANQFYGTAQYAYCARFAETLIKDGNA